MRYRQGLQAILLGLLVVLFTSRLDAQKAPAVTPAELIDLGRALFFDAQLSDPVGTSCASCHDPSHTFSGTNGSAVGVPRGSRANHLARRSSPSLLYLRFVPKFRFYQEGDDPGVAPFGGLFWDGRVDTITELVRQPLTNPDEMNNRDGRSVAAKIGAASYRGAFERAFSAALDDPEATLTDVGRAIEAYLTTDEMAPFSSKFDAFVRRTGTLSSVEMDGLRLFKDPNKGNCASCHVFNDTNRDPASSLFTDYGYDAVGVPRNDKVPGARKPDLGLCERTNRGTPSDDAMYCVNFRTPSLRNVAVRASFMHNGVFTSLRDVVAFYATRDTTPARWYKSGVKFDDVPKKFRGQVSTASPPYNRRAGDAPALSDQEIDAIVAFLNTLTDAPVH